MELFALQINISSHLNFKCTDCDRSSNNRLESPVDVCSFRANKMADYTRMCCLYLKETVIKYSSITRRYYGSDQGVIS